ncbi:MAG: glutamine synthetase [Paracoccaceae bacterium]|nr:MAG: glutamine synthetase [Paracoccaceae bacterium]
MPRELADYLDAHPGTRFLDAVMFDLCGTAIGKRYPVRDAAKVWSSGVAFCAGITTLDAQGACWDVEGIGFSDGDPDATSWPIPGTLAPVTWEPGVAQVLIAPAPPPDETGWWFDPRSILSRAVERFGALGLMPVAACELEFYLVDPTRDPSGRIAPARPARPGRDPSSPRVLAFDKLAEWSAVLADIDAACLAQGVPAGAATAEYGGAQFEVNLGHLPDPVAAADHALLLRRIVKGVARAHGLDATFMSKPFADQSGSGLHIHLSVTDAAGNIFDPARADGDLRLGHAIAGLQASTADAMAIFAPNLNAYRRFAVNQFVPVNTTWGTNNRSVAFRVPAGEGSARRIEHRIAGAEANPYLVMAAVLAGVHDGLARGLTPTPPSGGNAGDTADPDMPLRLWTALDRIERSAFLADWLGPRYPAAYAAIKRAEFEAFMSDVLPREYDWYL